MHNPFGFIKRTIAARCGNHLITVTCSACSIALLSFLNCDIRWEVTDLGDIEFEGNTLSFKCIKHTDNRVKANFQDLMEIEANDYPHKLWYEDGVRYFFAHLGSISSLDQYCVSAGDFVSVCALVMVTRGKWIPPGIVILLPGQELITVALSEFNFRMHVIGPNDLSSFSSGDGGDASSNDSHASDVCEAMLTEFSEHARGRGPPLSLPPSLESSRCLDRHARECLQPYNHCIVPWWLHVGPAHPRSSVCSAGRPCSLTLCR
ncbi:hypothetical protein ZWY2020_003513 [Hordeum vulgare]|nr:hypothetical protein ZWY2020_003513 [Hordeum vulgare]